MVRSWRYARLSPIIWHRIHVTYPDIPGWGLSPRGAGYLFGADITKAFAYNNAIDLIARAHQLAMEGFKLMFDQTIVTVWSAPNYCYRCVTISFIWPWARSSSFSAWLHMCTHIHTKGVLDSRITHQTILHRSWGPSLTLLTYSSSLDTLNPFLPTLLARSRYLYINNALS